MEYIKLLLFISYISCSVNNVSMQGYERQAEVPSFLIHCKETPVYSLLQCAALGRASKDVRFFFNKKDSYCRWNCTFLYTGRTVMTDQWQQYGMFLFKMYFVLFHVHVPIRVKLSYSCFLQPKFHMWRDFFVYAIYFYFNVKTEIFWGLFECRVMNFRSWFWYIFIKRSVFVVIIVRMNWTKFCYIPYH